MITYLEDGLLPSNRETARAIILQSEFYQIEGTQLIHLTKIRRKKQKILNPLIRTICLPPNLRLVVLEHIHDKMCHPTIERCYFSLRKRYFWKNLYADILQYTRSCVKCLEIRHTARKPLYLRQQTEILEPMAQIHLDHVGPISSYHASEYKYVLSAACRYTGYVRFIPVKDCSAAVTAMTFYDRVICENSAPLQIITDRGSAFLNEFLSELTKICGIRHLRTSAYHPQTNSGAENTHRFLNHGMRALIDPTVKRWERVIPSIQYAFNVLERPSLET
jgi:hypothetical protein